MVNLSEEVSAPVAALEFCFWRKARLCGGVAKSPNLWRTFRTDKQVNQQSGVSRDRSNMICLRNEATEPSMPSAGWDCALSAGAPAG